MDILDKPDEKDCCGSGCTPCILDAFEIELKKQNKKQSTGAASKNVLSPIKYTKFKVASIERIKDHILLTLDYTSENNNSDNVKNSLKYNPGQYLIIRTASDDTNLSHFTRPYTPIGSPFPIFLQKQHSAGEISNDLFFQIIVKIHIEGLMSQYLKNLQIGETTMWRGPYGSFEYKSNDTVKYVLMICQGTAIAPMFAIINEIINNDDDETRVMLYYCCKDMDNIIFRNEIYEFNRAWNFSYEVFLSEHSNDDTNSLKYKECINYKRLADDDINSFFCDKSNVQTLIAGSEKFMLNFDSVVKKCNISHSSIVLFKEK